jgi:hypothetical protein
LDIVDGAQAPAEPVVAIKITAEPEADLMDMQRLAGILADPEYANEPNTVVAPVAAAFPAGDDVHHAKNPADIRTNAPSMYPSWQATK